MTKRISQLSFLLAVILGLSFSTSVTLAQSNEDAEKLRQQALFEDYLNLDFPAAEAKLTEAIKICESACSASTKAKVLRDLGVVYVAGMKRRDEGIAMFIEALTADPSIQLDPDFASEELEAAMQEARELMGQSGPAPGGAPGVASGELLPVPEYEGVFHTPPTEQMVNTPLPLYIEVHDDEWVAKVATVKLHYRGFGMVRFKELEMPKVGEQGYGYELSCDDVGKSQGKIDYYITIVDEDGDVAATAGEESKPYTVAIKDSIDYAPAPIPGQPVPESCGPPVTADAPIAAPPSSGPPITFSDADCPPDFPGCGDEEEEPIEPPGGFHPEHWFTLSFQADFMLIPQTADACSLDRPAEFSCYEGDRPIDAVTETFPGASGSTGSGFVLGTKRILIGYDYAVLQNLLLGVRAGYALGGGPTNTLEGGAAFLPVHAEARGAWWFGENVLKDQFVRPYVQISGGLAQVDAPVDTFVVNRTKSGLDLQQNPPSPQELIDACTNAGFPSCVAPVTAWRKTGTVFAGAGVGVAFAVAENVGLLVEGRYMHMLPAAGSVLGAQAGVTMGF